MPIEAPRQSIIIFLSAVSAEFHHTDPRNPGSFRSYREALAETLRGIRQPHTILTADDVAQRADPGARPGHLAVITQENLAQGFGDLLQTLEDEVRAATVIIHLIGDMTGVQPGEASLQRLRARHPDLLAHEPALRTQLGNLDGFSYTQWELYFAFHHKKSRLVFIAADTAVRSPRSTKDPEQLARQRTHRERVQAMDPHYSHFNDQDELVWRAIKSLDRYGFLPTPPARSVVAEAIATALDNLAHIIAAIAAAIRKPDPAKVPVPDRAGVAVWLNAVDTVAAANGLNRVDILTLLDDQRNQLAEKARQQPDAAILLELALLLLALGEYRSCITAATRAAELATPLIGSHPSAAEQHREHALNAWLLIRDAASAMHDRDTAIRAVKQGGSLIDKAREPVFWADYHEPLCDYCIVQAQWQRAGDLISDILDIREEHQGENLPALAKTLLTWSNLLVHTGNYQGAHDVARRASWIFASLSPPDLSEQAAATNDQAIALYHLGRMAEAEPMLRRALVIHEAAYDSEPARVASGLNNLAVLLLDTNRLAEAEPMYRRALTILEASYGPQHPFVAIALNNLAALLQNTNRLSEAELMFRRALAIDEACFGSEHSLIAQRLSNLATLLHDTSRSRDAEMMFRRALRISEAGLGSEHPEVACNLNNLALLLQDTNRLAEAEPMLRRALVIDEASFSSNHRKVAVRLNNLGRLLHQTNCLAEAETMFRRALIIDEASLGPEHPTVAIHLNNFAGLLCATNRLAEAEPLMRRMVLISLKFTCATGHEHPHLRLQLKNFAVHCQQMAVPPPEIGSRLSALCHEAGLDEAKTVEILRVAFPQP